VRKHLKLLIALTCLAALVTITALVLRAREPRYRGHSLSHWLLLYIKPVDEENRSVAAQQSADAVRAIGTNALPCLLEWIRYEPSPVRGKIITLLGNLPSALSQNPLVASLFPEGPHARFELAVVAFDILGAQAAPAISELDRLMNTPGSPWTSRQAIRCLASIGPDAVPPISSVLANPNFPYRTTAADYAGFLRYTAGTNAASALPVLIQCATDNDPYLAEAAVRALGNIALNPDISIPPILNAIGSTNPSLRLTAARSLAKFGPQANLAIPVLLTTCSDSDLLVRIFATNALLKIAPQVLTNPPAL
jgi:hypothetical protein